MAKRNLSLASVRNLSFAKKERFLCFEEHSLDYEERFLVTKGMFPVLHFGNMMQRMWDGGRVVQTRKHSRTECRGRVLPGRTVTPE